MTLAAREEAILSVASDYLVGRERVGGSPGVRYVQDDSPEAMRWAYLTAAGYGSIVSSEGQTGFEIDLSLEAEGVVGITLWIRDRATLNRLKPIVDLSGLRAFVTSSDGKAVVDPWEFIARSLRDPGTHRSREQRLDPHAVATGFAVFYMSRSGGGQRTTSQAAQVFEARIGVHPEHHVAGWPSAYHRLIKNLRRRLGPLTPLDAESDPKNPDRGLASGADSRSDS